jgi:hypothetical protein
MKKLLFVSSLLSMLALSACASNYCQRKESWLKNTCVGTDVTWSHDATCENALENCDEGHIAQANAYVACLEASNVCSLDVMAACQAKHPGGVNLQCPNKI